MKLKLMMTLATALSLPVLLASAMAQQFAGAGSPPATTPPPPGGAAPRSSGAYVISEGSLRAIPVPVPPAPPGSPSSTAYVIRSW